MELLGAFLLGIWVGKNFLKKSRWAMTCKELREEKESNQ